MLSNPIALLGVLTLVPLIILYLIKPKPEEVEIPSLVLVRRMIEKEDRYKAFLRKFIRDPLLLIQALVLSFLTFAMVNPYYVSSVEVESENIVLVIDASASMQASDVLPSRFARAVEIASAAIGDNDRVSIILAESLPLVALDEGSGSEAKALFKSLKPKATETNLGEAILLARELLKDKNNTRILVASDFSFSSTDYEVARKVAESEGILVDYLRASAKGSNVGIVGLTPTKDGLTLRIKNYKDEEVTAALEVYREDALLFSSTVELPPGRSKILSIDKIPPGDIELALRHKDDLRLDDRAYLVIPKPEVLRVLLIRENQSLYLKHVLNSSGRVELREGRPPTLPSFEDYDLIVMDSVDPNSLLPGTIKDLRGYVSKGGNLVVIASDNLPLMGELEGLLPVVFKEGYGQGDVEMVAVNQLTRELELGGVVAKYILAGSKPASIELAVAAKDETPVLSFWHLGEGRVFYYGLKPDTAWGNFHLTPYYPIFWLNLMEYVKEEGETKAYKTGDYLTLREAAWVKTPSAEFKTDKVFLDEVGFYRFEGRKAGVSLLSEAESNITGVLAEKQFEAKTGRITAEVKREFEGYFLILALGLIGAELLVLRYRREF